MNEKRRCIVSVTYEALLAALNDRIHTKVEIESMELVPDRRMVQMYLSQENDQLLYCPEMPIVLEGCPIPHVSVSSLSAVSVNKNALDPKKNDINNRP